MVELVAVRCLLSPLADCVEHLALDLDTLIADGGVVEGAENVVDNFVNRDTRVLPGVDDAAEICVRKSSSEWVLPERWKDLRDNILKDRRGNPASTRVKDVCEVIL